MDITITETVGLITQIEKDFKAAEIKWKNSRTGKEKSKYWLEMTFLDGARHDLFLKRQKEIEEDLHSPIELSDGTTVSKKVFMDYQKQYGLTDEEMKNYIPLLVEHLLDVSDC